MIEQLKNRRTIRKYQDKDVDDQLIRDLLEASFHAPTNGNMQLYSVVVTRDPEQKKRLAPAHFNQPAFVNAPVSLTFCADFNRFNKWCEQRNAQPGYDNFLSFMTAVADTLLVVQSFCLAAENRGLGQCYMGTTIYNAPQISEVLKLPKFVVPIATITLGYPAEEPELQDRLPIDGIIHNETYQDYTDNDIDRLYAYKESLESSLQFIKENNKETLAQVFTDIRYSKANNEYFSKVFMDLIREKGF